MIRNRSAHPEQLAQFSRCSRLGILSWSMLEAMVSGCLLIGSRTAPVEEVLGNGRNGLLVEMLARDHIAKTVLNVIDAPQRSRGIRLEAMSTIQKRYQRSKSIVDCG